MSQLVPINSSQAPALAQKKLAAGDGAVLAKNFSDGVVDSYPVISIKGKIFRFKFQGEETPHVDANRYPIPYLDVVLVNGSPDISKVYYEKGFTEGDMSPPDCWSLKGVVPDPAAPKRQSPTCAGCKWNVFGSRITSSGKKAKACADSRRIVVALPQKLGVADTIPIMLRVPQSSTKTLREYVNYLVKNGFMPNACLTRMSFDVNEAFPRLNFQFAGPLTDQQYAHADALNTDERTVRILSAPIDGPAIEELDGSEPGTLTTARPDPVASEQYVKTPEAPPAPPPAAPAQEKMGITNEAAEFAAWKAAQAATKKAAPPKEAAPELPNGQSSLPFPTTADLRPDPEFTPPAFLLPKNDDNKTIEGTVNPEPPTPPEPKKRVRASQPPAQAAASDAPPATGAPASLDALLGGILST